MNPGQLVDDRFEVLSLAGAGGMGAVYRARDRLDGGAVALKVMMGHLVAGERFEREADVLHRLRHPGIVRYVAHGRTAQGAPYLAMEWLDGEDLGARLRRGPLSVAETIRLGEGVAAALGAAHAAGVVHRDVKPENVFLAGGAIEGVKLIDFGVARTGAGLVAVTRAGALVGTPGYMAPEQARGKKGVDARADVFSLGCVLFECLAGQAPFSAADVMAVLAKILLEDAPRLSTRRADVPAALDRLLARMLAKDPSLRPPDAAAVAAGLGAIADPPPGAEALPSAAGGSPAEALTEGELHVVSVVLVAPAVADPTAATMGATDGGDGLDRLRGAVAPFGMMLESLADGSLIGTEERSGAAGASTDQAAQAARAALALGAALPEARIALTTGRALVGERWPVGEVIDRAAGLLRAGGPPFTSGAAGAWGAAPARPVLVDDLTAGLLDARFDVGESAGGLVLHGEREAAVERRTLLGRGTPCVGREWELTMLEGLFRECVDASEPRVVLVTGEAGIGKSRLRHELLRALERGGAPHAVWIGRGDPVSAGAPFALIAPVLRRAAGILDGEPAEVRRRKLAERVARHVEEAQRARVAEFLGELTGAPYPDEGSVQLRAARGDAVLMGDQMRRAWEDFVAAEARACPLVLVLEDLHWGDLPTVAFVDAALRNLEGRPLLVLALARPEVRATFPDLWRDRGVQELRLGPLKRTSGERLVRAVLGPATDQALVARLVEKAEGNAFYLEELIRAAAEGKGEALPETVLAMVERRLSGLDPDARRVLRAASVFGQVFWEGAVAALAGAGVATHLAHLVDREFVTRRREARFPGETEYVFRNALVREAAHSTLTDADRRLGHRLAGAWRERAGETDAAVLAEHFERGAEPARAAIWYRRAAEQALEANDFAAAIARAEGGVRCGAEGEALGALRLLEAESHQWNGDNAGTEACALAATRLLPVGSDLWYAAIGALGVARAKLGKTDDLKESAAATSAALDRGEIGPRGVIAAAQLVVPLFLVGCYAQADALLATLERIEGPLLEDPGIEARLCYARVVRTSLLGAPGALLVPMQAAAAKFEEAGHLRNAAMHRTNVGYCLLEVGAHEEAERCLRDALATADRMGLKTVSTTARHDLGLVLAHLGALDEALAMERAAAEAFQAQGDLRMAGASRNYLAEIHLLAGDPARAEAEARAAVGLLAGAPPLRAFALATLAEARCRSGRPVEALAVTREATALYRELGGIEEGEARVLLVHAEALEANGDHEGARAAVRIARDRLLARAARIADPARSASFLARVPDNARTLALAQALLGEDGA